MNQKKFYIALLLVLLTAGVLLSGFYYHARIAGLFAEDETEQAEAQPIQGHDNTLNDDTFSESDVIDESAKDEELDISNETIGETDDDEFSSNNESESQKLNVNCDDDCKGEQGESLVYCQQVCGLSSIKASLSQCEGEEGLEKDYCLKDLALIKQNFDYCDQIGDQKIKETCNNRLTEEILDENSGL